MWTVVDRRDLRRWRIQADDPPPPLPRFQAVAAAQGEYEVIDRLLKFRATHTISANFTDPRSVAEAIAAELNQKYDTVIAERKDREEDGA